MKSSLVIGAALLLAAGVVAASISFSHRYAVTSAGGFVFRLDMWTGNIISCQTNQNLIAVGIVNAFQCDRLLPAYDADQRGKAALEELQRRLPTEKAK